MAQGCAPAGPEHGDDQGGQIRNIRNVSGGLSGRVRGGSGGWVRAGRRCGFGPQDVGGGGDELAGEAEAGADDGAVEAAGRVQVVPQDVAGRAGGGAYLVADDGSGAGQGLV